MSKDEALKLALDVLELVSIEFVCNGAHHAKKDRHEWLDPCPIVDRYKQAITAIKEALAQPEREPVVWMYQDKSTHDVRFQKHMRGFVDHGATYETPLYTSPPQQELVCVCGAVWEGQELIYTTPQRTWVGLPESAFAGMTLQQVTAMKYAEQILKDQNT
jgi:hypothetical protein